MVIDEAVINIDTSTSNITVREVRDHAVQDTYVATSVSISLNDDVGSTTDWELLEYSQNIEHLEIIHVGNIIGGLQFPTVKDAGIEYQINGTITGTITYDLGTFSGEMSSEEGAQKFTATRK